jgi:hypothetical protein
VRLGALAPRLHRRRVAVGVDGRGRLVLARPDSIQVDFRDDAEHRRSVLDLLAEVEAENGTDEQLQDAEDTGVLTVRVPPEGDEERWRLGPVDAAAARFGARQIRTDFNYVVFGAASAVPQALGAALTGSAVPPSTMATVMTPENRAVLLTTAEPTIAPAELRRPLDLPGHRRPRVLVIDTGLRTEVAESGPRPEHAFLQVGDPARVHLHDDWRSDPEIDAVDDEDEPDDDGSGGLDYEAGHGTFITGIVRQLCPDAEIHPAGVLSSFGEGSIAKVRATIRRLSRACGRFDLVVMSFGTYFADDDPGLFGARLPRLLDGALGVAAAGNLQSSRPYFPAALPGVIGVGGLDRGGAAWFSNFGGWVDASAPAVGVVSTFFNDFPEAVEGRPTRQFREWARWSGTSFAAPKVAGVIAQQMYLHQVSAAEAWQRVSSPDRFRVPDLGVVVNV